MWGGVLRGPQDVLDAGQRLGDGLCGPQDVPVQMQVGDLVMVSVALRMS